MRKRIGLLAAPAMALLMSHAVRAQSTTHPSASTNPSASNPSNLGNVVVESDLDVARDQIAPSLGAVTYTIGPNQIQNTPQGEDAPFQQVLLRAPGVVEDSFGQEHVRGEHANLTYRVNGVILPDALSTFGQELDTRLIDSVTLIDGTLPAQFGFRTAGVVDVTTKSGDTLKNNELSFYGGSYNTVEPSAEFGGVAGKWDYFITFDYKHDNLGIENPTSNLRADHDNTDQERNFDYFEYHIDETSRVTLLANASYSDFQIPTTPGLSPSFDRAGGPTENSEGINENQNEQNYYAVVSYQKSVHDLSFQASVYSSYGQIHFDPDRVGDLQYQGVSGEVLNNALTNGIQIDNSYIANEQHTLRFGMVADYTTESLNTNTQVFPIDPTTGLQSSSSPIFISDNSGNEAVSAGIYVQDEWRLTRQLTVNYGARFDTFNANFDNENQLSPRVNFVYQLDNATAVHAGYARYFVPPPVQNTPPDSVAKYAGTTNAPGTFLDDAPKVERSNYFDSGISHQITQPWFVNLDGFYKLGRNIVDEGQFGAPVIETPFNYKDGFNYGAELSSTYKLDRLSLFGNFSWDITKGRDIDSQQFTIDPAELDYIQTHYIHLDHQGEYTGSGGVSYAITQNDSAYVDVLYGSGLRSGFANDKKEPQYAPVNLGFEHTIHIDNSDKNLVKLRFDVLNAFDEVYQLRSGSGIGVGAPQFGARRAFYGGISYDF
jgi:outer membrane receptor protein involved in Fe transport